jgi:putative ABC transport system ATP-binding protein
VAEEAGAGQELLVAEQVTRSAPGQGGRREAVSNASLRVSQGELVAVLGRAGSGKSELLALCGGLELPEAGRVLVGGRDLGAMNTSERAILLARTIGWVFQSPRLVPLLTAEENVAMAIRLAGQPDRDTLALSRAALDAVGLAGRAAQLASDLSRGEGQRVALARALVKAPPLIIADEPTAQLDSQTAEDVLSLLLEAARSNIAVLFSTHDDRQAERADRVFLMDKGVLEETRPVAARPPAPRTSSPAGLPAFLLKRSS